jgi:hypothetical protein
MTNSNDSYIYNSMNCAFIHDGYYSLAPMV